MASYINSNLSASGALVVNDGGDHSKAHDGGDCHDNNEENFKYIGCGCIFVGI